MLRVWSVENTLKVYLQCVLVAKSPKWHMHLIVRKEGGFVTMRQMNLRDFEADMLSKIFNDVQAELELQQVTSENCWRSIQKCFKTQY